jgi:hypothetical protein
MILNGWYARYDKNMIELALMCLFMLILSFVFDTKTRSGKEVNVDLKIVKSTQYVGIGWMTVFFFWFPIFLVIAKINWQGWFIFVPLATSYYLFKSIELREKKHIIWSLIVNILVLIIGISQYINIFPNKIFIAENHLLILHLMIPEFILFMILTGYFMLSAFRDHKYMSSLFLSIILIIFIGFMPRLMILSVPLLFYWLSKLDIISSRIMILFMLVISLILTMPMINEFQYDKYSYLDYEEDICGDIMNCTIVSDYSIGHVLRYKYNHSVMFSGHPSNITKEMNILYYRNESCEQCVLVYDIDDNDRFELYRRELGLPINELFNDTPKPSFIIFP